MQYHIKIRLKTLAPLLARAYPDITPIHVLTTPSLDTFYASITRDVSDTLTSLN